MASLRVCKWKMLNFFCDFDLCVEEVGERMALRNFVVRPTMIQMIIDAQLLDVELASVVSKLRNGEILDGWQMSEKEGLQFMGRLCVPCDSQLKEDIFDQAHRSKLSIHPGSTKMYRDLRRIY